MKALMFALVLVVASVAFAGPVLADDPTPIDGTWAVTIQSPNGPVTGQLTLTTGDISIAGTLTGPNGDMTVAGTCDSTTVRLYAWNDTASFVFDGLRTPGVISGSSLFAGNDFGPWTAQRQ